MKQCIFLWLTFFLVNVSNASALVGFEKSIAIDKVFAVSKIESEVNQAFLQDHRRKLTDLVSNVFRSFQQDFDYRFYANYQDFDPQEATFICSGKLLDKVQINKQSRFYSFEGGEFFLRIELYDPKSNLTIFGKTFIIDAFIKKKDSHGLTYELQEGLKEPLAMYFFNTSSTITAHNNKLDSITLSIDRLFSSNVELNKEYLEKLTDLTSNAIVMHQKSKANQHIDVQKYPFRFFRNYQKQESGHQDVNSEFKGTVQFDEAAETYTLEIELFIDGKKVNLPTTLNPPIVFHEMDKEEYVDVALHIKQKVGLMLYYYFERYLSKQN
ncbi:MAG: hypothetical protein ACPGJS_18175 [Flammeovirgaceae bacterium]